MQDQYKHPKERIQTRPPESQPQAAATVCREDCLDMLEAIRVRAAGLAAPVVNVRPVNSTANYQAWATRAELDECNIALGQLLAMVDPQQRGAEQLVHDV